MSLTRADYRFHHHSTDDLDTHNDRLLSKTQRSIEIWAQPFSSLNDLSTLYLNTFFIFYWKKKTIHCENLELQRPLHCQVFWWPLEHKKMMMFLNDSTIKNIIFHKPALDTHVCWTSDRFSLKKSQFHTIWTHFMCTTSLRCEGMCDVVLRYQKKWLNTKKKINTLGNVSSVISHICRFDFI